MHFSTEDVIQIKKKAADFFSSRPEILFAFFFGSLAQGKGTPLSDLDFAVYLDEAALRQSQLQTSPRGFDFRSELTSQLMGALKTNEIDLVFLNEAPPLLRHRILTQGEKLMVRDPLREQRFFVRTLQDYFDTEPIRRIQARYLKDYLHGLKKSSASW